MNSGVNRKKRRSPIFILLLPAFALAAPLRVHAQTIDFSRLVVVGDSLAAGVENGSLEDSQQEHGFANVIAQQAGAPLVLPLVPAPGLPNTLELVSSQFPPVIEQVPGTVPFPPRDNPFVNITDLAVPGQAVADALNLKPNTNVANAGITQLATDLVLGFPCPFLLPCPALSQVQRAVLLRPTALIVDIGNNDILGAVTSGQLQSLLSDPNTFLLNFNNSYGSLLDSLALTGATLVVGNIPDVTEVPQLIPVSKLAQAQNLPLLLVLEALGVGPLDYVTLPALPAVEAILSGSTRGPLRVSCMPASPTHPCVVTFAQAVGVRLVTIEMNLIIQLQAALHTAVVVDLFSLIDNLHANGYKVGNFSLTTDYLGGLFSLDGLHPSNTGYGIMANEFIKEINAAFHTRIPPADILQIAEHDPLVLP
jgi:lysophospholipase L1-like esterase